MEIKCKNLRIVLSHAIDLLGADNSNNIPIPKDIYDTQTREYIEKYLVVFVEENNLTCLDLDYCINLESKYETQKMFYDNNLLLKSKREYNIKKLRLQRSLQKEMWNELSDSEMWWRLAHGSK